MAVPGQVPRNLVQLLNLLFTGQQAATDSPGQVLNDVLLGVGGLTTAGNNLAPYTAANVTWLAVGNGAQAFNGGLTALANEIARAPVLGVTLTGAAAFVTAFLSAGLGNGWLTEMGAFGGSAGAAPGSGTLYAYVTPPLPVLKTSQKALNLQWEAQ